MKYYTIVTSRDERIIGKYPQVIDHTKPREWMYPPLNAQIRPDNFLDFENYFDLILDDEAKLTDMIERVSVSFGMIINEKFKNIISPLNIPPHRFYPIHVIHQGQIYQYFWFHFYDDIFNYIDLNKSYFEIFKIPTFEVLETLPVTSEKFIREKKKYFPFDKNMRLKEIFLNEKFPDYDIWMNNILGFTNVISENFLNIIISNNITGFECNVLSLIHGKQ